MFLEEATANALVDGVGEVADQVSAHMLCKQLCKARRQDEWTEYLMLV